MIGNYNDTNRSGSELTKNGWKQVENNENDENWQKLQQKVSENKRKLTKSNEKCVKLNKKLIKNAEVGESDSPVFSSFRQI